MIEENNNNKQPEKEIKGIININKPQEFTSHDCVAIIRRLVGVKRVGHTGTLDPMATGVLPICIGNATRIMDYLDLDMKEYRGSMKLGIETDTYDVWGKVLKEASIDRISSEDIERVLSTFDGEVQQVPPKYSALKVNGRKLYEYARAGQDVEIKSRRVKLENMTVETIKDDTVTFSVRCSKGTYIRSICADAGAALGCGAAMSALERTASGIFKVNDAVDLEALREMDKEEILSYLLSIDYPLVHFGKIQLDKKQAKDFIDGKHVGFTKDQIQELTKYEERYKVYCCDNFIGVADIIEGQKLKVDKVFNIKI